MARKLTSITTHGFLKKGKLHIPKKGWFFAMLEGFQDDEVIVTVQRKKHTRTLKQNAYLWGVVYPLLAEYTGETQDELHKIFKAKYLQQKKMWRGGEYAVQRSTAELTSEEMGDFISSVVLEASDLGIEVPLPDKEYATKREFGSTMS